MSDCQCGGLKSIYSDRDEFDMPPKVMHNRDINECGASGPKIAEGIAIYRWQKVVEEYSILNLTLPSDKLPAIAGIARQLHPSIGCTYLAGIWGDGRIAGGLHWETVGTKRKKPKIWRAPSWSWASVEGIVSFPVGWVDQEYTVLKAVCTPLGPDQFGAVSDGYLTILGKLLRVGWSQISPLTELQNSAEDQSMFVLAREGLKEALSVSFDSCWPPADENHSDEFLNGKKQHGVVFCFMLGCRKRVTGRESPSPLGLVYLVLQCVDEAKQLYERVGIGHEHSCYDLFSEVEESVITIK